MSWGYEFEGGNTKLKKKRRVISAFSSGSNIMRGKDIHVSAYAVNCILFKEYLTDDFCPGIIYLEQKHERVRTVYAKKKQKICSEEKAIQPFA